jgi:hypothetical protein
MNAKPERNRAELDVLKHRQAATAAEPGARYFFRPPVVRKS